MTTEEIANLIKLSDTNVSVWKALSWMAKEAYRLLSNPLRSKYDIDKACQILELMDKFLDALLDKK